MEFLILFAGGALLILAVWLGRRGQLRVLAGLLTLLGVIGLVVGGVLVWYTHRPLPEPVIDQPLFQGITYSRQIRSDPRPLVIHIVRIDLTAPGIAFFARPGTPGEPLPMQTTSAFLAEYDLQLAINANLFYRVEVPAGPFDWVYLDGALATVRGPAVSEGVVYQTDPGYFPGVYFAADNTVTFEYMPREPWNGVGGNYMLVRYGERAVRAADNEFRGIHPRTAIGINEAGTLLTIVVVDGRQPGYSEGVSLWELSDLMREYGTYYALNLDGGGSSTLVVEGADGRPDVLNSPIGNRIPGLERPVPVQLGVRALPVGESE